MKKRILFLKVVLVLAVLVVLMFGVLVTTQFFTSEHQQPFSAWLFVAVVLIAIALMIYIAYLLNQLLNLIDHDRTFSTASLPVVRKITASIFAIGIDAIGIMPFVFFAADADDAPGLVLMGAGLVFIPYAVGVFATVLEQLLINAITIKKENDLTV